MELILTVMADDRPGIAERLAREIEQQQGNWLESRMATMAGKFAGIVRIELPEHNFDAAQLALQGLASEGLAIQMERGHKSTTVATEHRLEVVGNDRPGIVREVTNALANLAINVIDLHTEIEPASMSGGTLFRANIEFTLTESQSMTGVVKALEALSPDLMVDL
ncbi:glycine cleavage system protein R [Reinekea sp.]|jgi:glycine cleavage system regulatory protein|uniref:glycine cleavage system protein R n=1 Tax=Reinekea sp. TaxID=1970455 RepID=UPI002A7F1A6B|nr:ACT domain-containing protein [Reinekea sp.]